MKVLFGAILFSIVTSSCTKENHMSDENQVGNNSIILNQYKGITYLALGDSYTIGESVPQAGSFPYQLQNFIAAKGVSIANPKIIAKTGFTTDELKNAIIQAKLSQKYDFVTLLIGVNNQYRGYPITTYKKEFSELLQTAIAFANGRKERVFIVSIPDWGVTPFGKNSGRNTQTIANEIDAFNQASREIALAAGISYSDITPASRNVSTDLSLVAGDGLHPSAKMYGEWANVLLPKVLAVLQ